jgi:transposase
MSSTNAESLTTWVQAALADETALQAVYRESADGERVLVAEGYEIERSLVSADENAPVEWDERVIVARSEAYREQQQRRLEQRLKRATEKLRALTPEPGRGKRQIRDETALVAKAEAILQAHNVAGLLSYTFERQVERETRYVGRGRGGANRPTREVVTVRYQITGVHRETEALTAVHRTLGWRMYVTHAPATELSLEQAVLVYRDEWIIERNFHRLKGTPLSLDPLFVKRDDQIAGLTHLLSLGGTLFDPDGVRRTPQVAARPGKVGRTACRESQKGDRQTDHRAALESV